MSMHKIENEIAEIKRFIAGLEIAKKEIMTLSDAEIYLSQKKSSIYKLTSTKKIPFHRRPGSKLIYFKKAELDAWMLGTRELTLDEIKENALPKRQSR